MRVRSATCVSVILGLGSFEPPAQADVLEFAPPTLIEFGLSNYDFDFADVDGDGDTDIILNQGLPVGVGNPAIVGIMKNRGDATFDPVVTYPIGSSFSLAMAVADFDNDGDPDVAKSDLLNGTTSELVILYNDGDGAFPIQRRFPGGAQPQQAAAGDINGDGWSDVVVTMSSNGSVWVYLNDGAGGFEPPLAIPTGAGPVPLRLADFDGDGDLDVCVVNIFEPVSFVFIENVNGVLGPLHHLTASLSGRKILTADFDDDGFLDIMAFNRGFQILLNQGDFQFSFSNPIPIENDVMASPKGMSTENGFEFGMGFSEHGVSSQFGDIDLDGVTDLISPKCATFGPQSLVTITQLQGPPYGLYPDLAPVGTSDGVIDGTDLVQLLNEWGPGPVGGAAVDLNHDLTANGWDVARLLANWGPLPEQPPWIPQVFDAGMCPVEPRLVDLDGDGDLDVISNSGVGVFLYFENLLIRPMTESDR